MDESGPRFVHGRVERFPDLDAVLDRNCNWRAGFWRIQSARVRHLFIDFLGNRGIDHERIKIWRGPAETQTCSERPDGAVTESPAKVSYPL